MLNVDRSGGADSCRGDRACPATRTGETVDRARCAVDEGAVGAAEILDEEDTRASWDD